MNNNTKDIFDDVLDIEHTTYVNAKNEGTNDGLKLGYVDGFQLGHQKGSELGQELGYIYSCVLMWNNLIETHKDTIKFSARGLNSLEKLTSLLNGFNLDFTDDDIMNTLADIRLKFKLASAQLSLQTVEHQDMSF